ncbi:MAG: DUF2029 domain-containing protein [Oscillospiraceae bacterium]|nr:DUF2029 domain-containing protein [Oscillospiraceae bacterium]
MYKKNFFSNFSRESAMRIIFITVILVCGIMVRMNMFLMETGDMKDFLSVWYNYLKANGGFRAVGDDIGDYTPLYYYFLAAITYTNIDYRAAIKILSCIFDFIMAFHVMKTVKISGASSRACLLSFAMTIFLPTVILNSSGWGQCDSLYTCFLVICLYNILKGNDLTAMIMFGISFSLKLQAVFFAPFLCILMIKGKIRPTALLCIPAVYVISILPAVCAGGDFIRLLTVYFRQAGEYDSVCLSISNAWALIKNLKDPIIGGAGIFFAGGIIVMMIYYYTSDKNFRITQNTAVAAALMSSFVMPFLLPYMHERYYYPAEIMTVIFVFYYHKRLWLPAAQQFCSCQCYFMFLYPEHASKYAMPIQLLTLIEFVNIAAIYLSLKEEIASARDEELVMKFERKQAEKQPQNA